MNNPLLNIENHHSASCGDPPIIDCDSGSCYVGYFENPHGEQWIFTLDRTTGEALLRGGDLGWNVEAKVVDGCVTEFILAKAEQMWLQACWLAAKS